MHCLICGYDLSGSPRGVCPECGTTFAPGNPSTYASSPSLAHRLLRHAPALRERYIAQHTEPACRGCGGPLADVEGERCPECNGFFDLDDPSTYLRAPRGMPRGLLRFQHVAPGRGLLLPAVLLTYGIGCLLSGSAHMLGRQFGVFVVHGQVAWCLGVAWAGAALALHAHYFWGRVEPWWRHAPLGTMLGAALMAGGLVAAVWIAVLGL